MYEKNFAPRAIQSRPNLGERCRAAKTANPFPQLLENLGFTLKREGGYFRMICPFHAEDTGSFTVHPGDTDSAYCYGCRWSGDVIDFVQEINGVTFDDALGILESSTTVRFTPSRRVCHHESPRKPSGAGCNASLLSQIAVKYSWPDCDVWEDSPIRIDHGIEGKEPQVFIRAIYLPISEDNTIWIGEVHHSGEAYREHFKTAQEWLAMPQLPGTRICNGLFTSGEFGRRSTQVVRIPYITVEIDEGIGRKPQTPDEVQQNRDINKSVIRFLRERCGLKLVAMIDTGGKSVHGWFEKPDMATFQNLQENAPLLGIDGLLAHPAHPVRLPGFRHEKTGKLSRLLWLERREG